MSHAEVPAREGFWTRTRRWLTDTYVDDLPAVITCHCGWQAQSPDGDALLGILAEHQAAMHPAPDPDLADDLPHVLTELSNAAAKATGPTQRAMVLAVTTVLEDHTAWLTGHPDATQAERTATAQRAVFRAVQAGIDVVRPAAQRQARRAALEEAAAYVIAQRSTVEAAEGLRRHLSEDALPMRVERYPVAEQAARTTGPLPVVEAVEVIDIN